MSITVGRLTLPDPKDPVDTGQSLSFSGLIHTETQAVTNARRRQITGMKGELVPVIWTPGEIDGFYRVSEAQCDVMFLTSTKSAMRYSLQLEFVGHQPDFESLLIGAQVPNVHGITGTPWWAVPADASSAVPVDAGITLTRTAEDADVRLVTNFASTPAWGRFSVGAADFYDADCRIEVAGSVVEGAEAPHTAIGTDSHVVTNGLVRFATTATSGTYSIDVYTGSAWRTKQFVLTGPSAPITASVVRNEPHVCVLRLNAVSSYLDVTVRRGGRFVTVKVNNRTPTTTSLRKTGEAATAITGGVRATANDAAGNRFVMSSPLTFTADTTDGGLLIATTDLAIFNVGYEIAGSGAVAGETASDVVAQSMWHTDERVRAVRV